MAGQAARISSQSAVEKDDGGIVTPPGVKRRHLHADRMPLTQVNLQAFI
jgi:hypothetical protein